MSNCDILRYHDSRIMIYHYCENYHDCHILQIFGTNKQTVVYKVFSNIWHVTVLFLMVVDVMESCINLNYITQSGLWKGRHQHNNYEDNISRMFSQSQKSPSPFLKIYVINCKIVFLNIYNCVDYVHFHKSSHTKTSKSHDSHPK